MASAAESRRRQALYDGGHVPPLDIQVTTISSFLDEIMGRITLSASVNSTDTTSR